MTTTAESDQDSLHPRQYRLGGHIITISYAPTPHTVELVVNLNRTGRCTLLKVWPCVDQPVSAELNAEHRRYYQARRALEAADEHVSGMISQARVSNLLTEVSPLLYNEFTAAAQAAAGVQWPTCTAAINLGFTVGYSLEVVEHDGPAEPDPKEPMVRLHAAAEQIGHAARLLLDPPDRHVFAQKLIERGLAAWQSGQPALAGLVPGQPVPGFTVYGSSDGSNFAWTIEYTDTVGLVAVLARSGERLGAPKVHHRLDQLDSVISTIESQHSWYVSDQARLEAMHIWIAGRDLLRRAINAYANQTATT